MAVRNFWADIKIDGRTFDLRGGPQKKDGGMQIDVYQRENGGIMKVVKIVCSADEKGSLKTSVFLNEELIGACESER